MCAGDGVDAIAKTLRLQPDVITLDLEMPTMDGFTFLRWLMKERPTPVLVLSSRSDSRSVFRAMELGAVDFLAKPEARISRSIEGLRDELVAKVHAVLNLEMSKVQSAMDLLATGTAPQPALRKTMTHRRNGGRSRSLPSRRPPAGRRRSRRSSRRCPRDFGAGIVISQHMPPGFTRSFAERLNKLSALMVSEAEPGDRMLPGPGADRARRVSPARAEGRRAGLIAELVPRVPEDKYVPSADRMMVSVAEACGPAALGVVLTGMGNDGAEGALAIKNQGGQCLAESEESAVVFGMPQEAIRTGAVDKVLPLGMMAGEIQRRCSRNRTGVVMRIKKCGLDNFTGLHYNSNHICTQGGRRRRQLAAGSG